MTKPNQKTLLVLFSALLFAGFLFFLPQGTYAADSAYTAGYYQDKPLEDDTYCSNGHWRAHVEVKDYDGNPLVADTIMIQASYYPRLADGSYGNAVPLLDDPLTTTNATSFETPCEIDTKEGASSGLIALYVQVGKSNYYDMVAANPSKESGSSLNKKRWSKTIYLAQLGDGTDANFAFLSPAKGEWISETSTTMQVKVNKPAGLGNINKIEMKIKKNDNSGQDFILDSGDINVASGTISLTRPDLIDQGEYTWTLKMMRSGANIFYNEYIESNFGFDSIAPSCVNNRTQAMFDRMDDPEEQRLWMRADFTDSEPGSGIHKIELYYKKVASTTFDLAKTCITPSYGFFSDVCSTVIEETRKVYKNPETYTVYAVGYDHVGHKANCPTRDITTLPPPADSNFTVSGQVSLNDKKIPFKVISVNPAVDGVPIPGDYETEKTFHSSHDYTIKLEAPESHNNKAFSFWALPGYSSSAYAVDCFHNASNTLNFPVGLGSGGDESHLYTCMFFGVSHLNINRRVINADDWWAEVKSIKTKITQEGGKPNKLLDKDGLKMTNMTLVVRDTKEIEDLVLEAHDSEDGLLKFSGWYRFEEYPNYFCKPDPANPRQCKGSLLYGCGQVTLEYLLVRKVKVKAYIGNDSDNTKNELAGGVLIEGDGGMETGITTAAGGYYEFSSTAQPKDFSGTLWAPKTIPNPDDPGASLEFEEWRNCQDTRGNPAGENKCVGTKKCGCYIGTGLNGWHDNISVTVEAHYSGSAPAANRQLIVVKGGTGWDEGIVTDSGGIIDCGPTCNADFTSGAATTLTAATTTASSRFIGWDWSPFANCGALGNTLTCTMNSDTNVTSTFEHIGPTAAMACQIVDCIGCVCAPGTWETYNGPNSTDFRINNLSTAPGAIVRSTWSILGYQDPYPVFACATDPLCDMGRMPGISAGNYDIKLVVEDQQGFTDEVQNQIRVKQDITPDFECSLVYSLNPLDYDDCEDGTKIAPLAGQTVYFMDKSTASEDGVNIAIWEWKKGKKLAAIGDFEPFGLASSLASTTLTTATNTVYLKVWDVIGRSDSVRKTLNVTLPLPEYREVSPATRQDNFLARLGNIFARF